jgi:hypothetical protein
LVSVILWLHTARTQFTGAGTQTAALGFGGDTGSLSGATEEYDGNSWTSGNSLNTARSGLAGAGIQTAAIAFGGSGPTGATEEYDGTSWTTSPGSLNTARNFLGGAGTQTAALAFGGKLQELQEQQKCMMDHLDKWYKYGNSKI